MPAAELDLVDERSIMQGDSWELTVTVGGGLYSGVDFSDPGWEFAASLRPGYSMVGTPVDFAVAVDDGTVGTAVVTLSLTPAQTAAMAWRESWVWDFEVSDPDGGVLTLLRGVVTVLAQVTAAVVP